MIYLYCIDYIYELNKVNIDYILLSYKFIKKIIINDENDMYDYIVKNELLYKNNIYVGIINENTLKRISVINDCNNFYILNINELNINNDYSYLINYNSIIIDFNLKNIDIFNKYNYKNIIKINDYNNQNDLLNFNKIYDIAIINNLNSESKNNIYKKLKYNNINIDIINISDINIYKYKIILNIDNEINKYIYERLICNKNIIINNKVCKDKELLFKNNYSIDINYDSIPIFTLFIIKNYEQVFNNIYKNLNIKNESDINIDFEEISFKNTKHNDIVFNEIEKNDKFGFIIVRHVTCEKTNNYWNESYKSIRKYYNNKIVIIDDNSNYDYVKLDDNIKIYNCNIIQSEYNARGEILGYYYFYNTKPFEKAVIIHDSVFINTYIDFNIYDNIKFIWHFTSNWFDETAETLLINKISNGDILKKYYNNRELIHGCFGVQSVISYKFLHMLEEKYSLFNLLDIIYSRNERMNLERIFALMCIHENNELSNKPSIFGVIHQYTTFGYSYEDYIKDKNDNNLSKEIIKVWTGR
jgi:hypothetical protein